MEREIEYFEADQSPRFKQGQKVWIESNQANHLQVFYKYRGKGRYVSGLISKGGINIKKMNITQQFYNRIKL